MYDITADSLSDEELETLEDMGRPELVAGHYDYCPTCAKLGRYIWRGQERACDCATQLALAQHYTLAGIPHDYQILNWDDLETPPHADIIDYLSYLDAYVERGMGVLLTGPRGTGKTMVLTLILKELVKRGHSCYTTDFNRVVDQLVAGWGPGASREAQQYARRFMHSKALQLDDLGKEFKASNRLAATTFDNVLRTRVQANRVTLLSSNLDITGITTGYGEGVLSLLVEKSVQVDMTGVDYRPRVNARLKAEVHSSERRPIV